MLRTSSQELIKQFTRKIIFKLIYKILSTKTKEFEHQNAPMVASSTHSQFTINRHGNLEDNILNLIARIKQNYDITFDSFSRSCCIFSACFLFSDRPANAQAIDISSQLERSAYQISSSLRSKEGLVFRYLLFFKCGESNYLFEK